MSMAKINLEKIVLNVIKGSLEPFANPVYPHTWLMQAAVKHLEKMMDEMPVDERKYTLGRTFKKLLADKMITLDKAGLPQLTKKGEERLLKHDLKSHIIVKPQKWDEKYRVIVFDIGEEKRKIRSVIRRQLTSWGFVRLQNSVWVIPYECQESVSLLKAGLGVTGDVLYMTVDSIENDDWLKKEFKLN